MRRELSNALCVCGYTQPGSGVHVHKCPIITQLAPSKEEVRPRAGKYYIFFLLGKKIAFRINVTHCIYCIYCNTLLKWLERVMFFIFFLNNNKHVDLPALCNGVTHSSPNLPPWTATYYSGTPAGSIPSHAACVHRYRQHGSAPPPASFRTTLPAVSIPAWPVPTQQASKWCFTLVALTYNSSI